MLYSVRNRRRLRPTGEQPAVPARPVLARGTGVPHVPSAEAIAHAVEKARGAIKEIVPASVIEQNWQR